MAKASIDWGTAELLAPEDNVRSIIAASQGQPGGGKSHFWLTAKGPIAWHLFDPGGLKGLRNNPLFSEKEVRVFDYCPDSNIAKLDKADRIAASIKVFDSFRTNMEISMKHATTIVVDKESLLWELIRYAHDEVESPTPKNFHELNMFYKGWVHEAEVRQRNLGFLRDTHDTWGRIGVSKSTGQPQLGFTGKMKPDGCKHVPGLVQIQLEHRWNEETRKFTLKILDKCRLGDAASLMGKEMSGMDFPTLGQLLFPDSGAEDWE